MSHYPKDVPFEVPEGWVWTTIGDILINRDGERIPVSSAIRKKQNAKLYDYYGAAGVIDKVDDYLFNERLLLVGEDGANLLSRSKDNAFFAEGKYWVNNHAHIIDASDKRLLDYIALYINAISLDMYVTGSAQPKLNQDNLNRISVPLPPLAEQFRIVQAVEECKRIVNGIENNQIELQEAIDHTKQKILSLAIAGKLVSQDLSDEPAIVLMKRINPAFQASDNLHYEGELPRGWVVCTLADVSNYGKCVSVPVSEIGDDAWVLELEDIEKDTGQILYRGNKKNRDLNGIRHIFHKNQVLYSKLRTYLNKVLVADDNGFCTTEIIPISTNECILPEFLNVILRSPYFLDYTASCGYGVKMPRLGTNDARRALIPLPPILEQARIIKVVNELLLSLDKVRNMLELNK